MLMLAYCSALSRMSYAYSNVSAAWLRNRFGADRIEIVRGDSAVTIPRWTQEHLLAGFAGCDVVMIDGEHTYAGELANLRNLRPLAAQPRNLLVHDDCVCTWSDLVDRRRLQLDHNAGGSRYSYTNKLAGWFWQRAVAEGLVADEGGRKVRHVTAEIDGEMVDSFNFVSFCVGRFLKAEGAPKASESHA